MKTILCIITFAGVFLTMAGATSNIIALIGVLTMAAGAGGLALHTYITNPKEFEREWKW